MGFPGGSVLKNLPAKQMWVWSLGWEDPLEKEMATYSSLLVWDIPWTEEPGGLQSIRLTKESDMTWRLNNNNSKYKCVEIALLVREEAEKAPWRTCYSSVHVFSRVWLLCESLDCRPADSSVHGIFQAGILEWVAISSSRGSSRPRDWTYVSGISFIAGRFFTTEPPGKPKWVMLKLRIVTDLNISI